MSLGELQKKLLGFAKQRDWEQFHSPKNISMALAIEAAELMEHFQWLTEEQSYKLPGETLENVSHELADVFIYTLLMAEKLNIDLHQATQEKIAINEKNYPADLVRGSAKKHNQY